MSRLSLNLKNLRTLGDANLSAVQGGTGGIFVPTTYDESVGCDTIGECTLVDCVDEPKVKARNYTLDPREARCPLD